MQAHTASPVDANRAGHFHGEIKDLPKLRVRMDKLALSYRAQYGIDADRAFGELVQEYIDQHDDEDTAEHAADLVLINTEGMNEQERHLRAYEITKRRYQAAEQRAHQGSLFEVGALAQPEKQHTARGFVDESEYVRLGNREKQAVEDRKRRRVEFDQKVREDYQARVTARPGPAPSKTQRTVLCGGA